MVQVVDQKVEKAWAECTFCSQPDKTILAILEDPEKWNKELPLNLACAWKRISQVAFRNRLQVDGDWKGLCRARSAACNEPSYGSWKASIWNDGYCKTYVEMNPEDFVKRRAPEGQNVVELTPPIGDSDID